MKIPKILKVTLFLLLISSLTFTLSSKSDDINDFEPLECEQHTNDETLDLQLYFRAYQGWYNIPGRASAYTDWWPYNDLRASHPYPESSLANTNESYYCIVKVSIPSCPGWGTRTTVMSQSNGGGDGVISVTVPDSSLLEEILVKVDYYERSIEFPYVNGYYGDKTMLRYHHESYIVGYDPSGVPIQTELVYAENIDASGTGPMGGPPPPIHPLLEEIE